MSAFGDQDQMPELLREIAEQLGVSVRTVNNLLQRVYVKLGIHGRAELAARLE